MPFRRKDWLSEAAVILCLCMPFSARAAEFSKAASANGGADIIFVVGDLTLGDEKKFVNAALSSGNAIVVFQSPGGNLIAGIEIGKAIHLKGFSTFVPETVQCASACALAWLGGRVRYMSNTARVGFHAVYVDKGGQAAVSSAGNALVGAYLNQLGLPTSAIIYITNASPQGMQWLNFTDAQNYGIDVRPFNLTALPAAPENSEPSSTQISTPSFSSQMASVKTEVSAFVRATNRLDPLALYYLQSRYGDEVDYYGKVLPRLALLKDKRTFFRKWPIRNYSTDPASISVSCLNTTDCKAEAIVNWNASGSNLNSTGSAVLSLHWVFDGGMWKISSENSRIINRRVSSVPPPTHSAK
jgi:hypothetical protein